MGIRASLRNGKHESRWIFHGGLALLTQRLYETGFKEFDGGKLDKFLGEESQLPDSIAAGLFILASYKAGKAIDGGWIKPLRGSVQTITYTTLLAALFAAGTYLNPEFSSQVDNEVAKSIDYVATVVKHIQDTISVFSDGEMAPLLYTVTYGGLLTGAVRWGINLGSSIVELFAGKAGPSEDYNDGNGAQQK